MAFRLVEERWAATTKAKEASPWRSRKLLLLALLALPGAAAADDLLLAREDDTVVGLLEPRDGVALRQAVRRADGAAGVLALRHAVAAAAEHDEEVHAVDAGGRVVLDPEVDVLVDAEAERAVLGEVVLAELVLLHLEA